jgi:hypothetical protein
VGEGMFRKAQASDDLVGLQQIGFYGGVVFYIFYGEHEIASFPFYYNAFAAGENSLARFNEYGRTGRSSFPYVFIIPKKPEIYNPFTEKFKGFEFFLAFWEKM